MATTINNAFEYVSIAMDDEELSDEMLDRLLADDEAYEKWYEYHLISDCMRQHRESVGRDAGFMQSSRFQAELAEISREHRERHLNASFAEAAKTAGAYPANNGAFVRFAVAASVAAVAVSVWQFWPQAGSQQPAAVAVEKPRPRQADQNVVSVRAAAENKAASETVVPNAVKQLPSQQSAVRTESNENGAAGRQQDVVH